MQQTSEDFVAQLGRLTPAPTKATPAAILHGLREQRRELSRQLSSLEDRRQGVASQLQRTSSEANRRGLEQRLADLDARILDVEKQIAAADAEVARAAAVPGAVPVETQTARTIVAPPRGTFANPPEEYIFLSGMFMLLVLFPISLGYARRLWKRGAQAVAALPHDLMERFGRLEQAVDSISLEVERIGEGQRFMTRVFARHAEPGETVPTSLTDELQLPKSARR